MAERRAWTREELVAALALYCQVAFGKMHTGNPLIIALAGEIGRTPGAVSLKLVNFASLDPELRGRGVGGMGNTSVADRAVWAEFFGRWEELAAAHAVVMKSDDVGGREAWRLPEGPTEVERVVKQRRGQAFFRAAVLAAHNGACCVTGIRDAALLRASHIVPWAAEPGMRVDPRNGLCLNALHDAAFDRGLMTLTDGFEVLLSKKLKGGMPRDVYGAMFERYEGAVVTRPERFVPTAAMLAEHRRARFVG